MPHRASRLALSLALACAGVDAAGASKLPKDASDDDPVAPVVGAPAPPHANPRLKLSYRRFAAADLDGKATWLDGAQLDVYPLSRRFVRVGFELEGGAGRIAVLGQGATIGYGLLGASAGFQYPARVTPFVDGRFAAGLLGVRADGPITIPEAPGMTFPSGPAVTWIYLGGLEGGVELYTVGRLYVSAAVGWVRSTWRGPDEKAMRKDPMGGLRTRDLTGDSFTFKLSLGI